MDKVINLGIPHIGELIFESIDTDGLFQCLSVSETWKVLAENVLMKRWKSRMFEACIRGVTQIVKLLLERGNCEFELNAMDNNGMTAFIGACRYGHKDIVQLLLDDSSTNIDLNARSNKGLIAFMAACRN